MVFWELLEGIRRLGVVEWLRVDGPWRATVLRGVSS